MSKEKSLNRISSNSEIMHGKPCIKGTRIPVWLVIAMLGDGMTEDEILSNYPSLSLKDIKAALKYTSYATDFERIAL